MSYVYEWNVSGCGWVRVGPNGIKWFMREEDVVCWILKTGFDGVSECVSIECSPLRNCVYVSRTDEHKYTQRDWETIYLSVGLVFQQQTNRMWWHNQRKQNIVHYICAGLFACTTKSSGLVRLMTNGDLSLETNEFSAPGQMVSGLLVKYKLTPLII